MMKSRMAKAEDWKHLFVVCRTLTTVKVDMPCNFKRVING